VSSNGLTADLVVAERFLTLLTDGAPITFQTFADSSDGRHLARILHGTLADHGNALQTLNQAGAGVFLMVNAGDGQGRKSENVVRVRALFADLDGAPLDPVLVARPEPHLIIESSPGRYHAYWLIKDCPLDRFTPLQAALAVKFVSDTKVKDLPRVMRLPGFWHQKAEPFQSRILAENTVAPYTVAELEGRLGLLKGPTALHAIQIAVSPASTFAAATGAVSEGSRNGTLTSLAGTMRRRGMSTDAIHAALQQENATRCQPPLDAADVRSIAESVSRYAPDAAACQPQHSRRDLAAMIDATDDFDDLTGHIAELVSTCDLKKPSAIRCASSSPRKRMFPLPASRKTPNFTITSARRATWTTSRQRAK